MTRIPACPPATTRELQNFVTSRQARAPDIGPDILSTWILPRPQKRPHSQVRYEQRRKKRRLAREKGIEEEPKDEDLFVMTMNVMHSRLRLKRLVQDQLEAVHPADIISLQDVPQSLPSMRLSGYNLAYHSDRVIEKGEDGQPVLDDKGRPKEIMELRYVAFLVRTSIPLANWRAFWDEGANKGLLATAVLETDYGPRTILNLYNHLERANFDEIPFEDGVIFCGDINAHDPLWGGEKTEQNSSGKKARQRLDAAEMINVGPRGVPTYYGGDANTTIDVICLGKSAHSFFKRSEVLDHRDFQRDHRPLLVVLHGGPHRDDSIRYLWRKVSEQTLAYTIPRYLKLLGNPPLNTQADIDRHIARLLRLLSAAIADCVPTVKRNPFRPNTVKRTVTSAMQRDMALERKAARALSRLCPRDRGYKKTVRRYEALRRGLDVFNTLKQGVRWATKTEPAHSPPLQNPDGTLCESDAENAACFRETVWGPATSTNPSPLERPVEDPSRPQHFSPQHLRQGDLKWALEAAPTGKACGPDQVAVDVFKKCPGVFHNHLTRIMNACLRLEYHPDEFKRSITVVLRKPDRTDFSLPKSWRPVALLSCLGKLLERVVAKRIQELAVKHRLIPRMQFGFPGRCTTKCIESLLSPVYRGFCVKTRNRKKWRSTLLSLDISGAYDHVNRPELLRILVRKGKPDWIVNFIWSFLSDRRTMLRFPGYNFERLHPDLNVFAFSYVDDSYILVTSRTFKENCEILEMYHEQVMEWATPNGIRFDPGKYKVMHFTRNEKCDLCPKISGLTVKHVINNSVDPEAPKHLRILGVMVDPALKWDAHIANLESKVKKKLGFLKRISSSVMGPNLIDMRRLYITSVRPIITYACACWFVLADGKGQQFRITKKLIARLDRLQRECLVNISGAYNQTPVMVLQKELNIEPIEVALHRIAMAHRVRNTNTLEGERMLKVARRPFHRMRSFACFDLHPYWVAYQQAGLVRDEIVQHYGLERSVRLGRNVAGWFNQYLRQQGLLRSAYLWAEFAEEHALKAPRTCGYEAVTYMGEWCTNIMSIHMGKTRAQSTILIHMRTGHNGLNSNLYSINKAETNMCPCGEGEHTVEHVLFDCVSLERQRRELLPADYGKCDDDLRRLKLRYLLTQCAGPVSAWALKHFELEQFSWTKEHLPIRTRAFPFSSGTRHRRV
ncbi:Retrovirus-related Pol polyprotein [Colletotrichum gloeosporioides]|uniref:Retrovirus-related Pol polyprotein n=1 Tax=Colletotrichum gloeosporioides TaxID=474922 RepID=A0A8H4C9R5_COLGL|nr:Retrovirus-related Pol polyprotein [Colletotrichum gloeosporioides]KAF3799822.1 Retrovirus-related Pol polyprotein [Colletotrichum gloeosporioides]